MQRMNRYLKILLVPPLGTNRCTTCTGSTGPICVLWLFGLVSVIFGLLGGPTTEPGISWYMVGFGTAIWIASASWSLMVTPPSARANSCDVEIWNPKEHRFEQLPDSAKHFKDINKAH